MKRKLSSRKTKLKLNSEAICKLNHTVLNKVYGGAETDACITCPTVCDCPIKTV